MKTLWSRLRSHALYGFPRPLLPPRNNIERLRAYSLAERLRTQSFPVMFSLYLVTIIGYPFAAAFSTRNAFREIRRRNALISSREILHIYADAMLRNIPPTEYAVYEFDRSEARAASADYLYWTDTPTLQWMNRQRGADNRDVQDKARFALLCMRHGLDHVTVLAEFRNGRQVAGDPVEPAAQACIESASREPASSGFWVKPLDQNASRGALAWTPTPRGLRSSRGDILPAKDWVEVLLRQDCVVQRRIRNHREVEPITNGALAAVRLNTVVDRAGTAELIGAMISLPFGSLETTTAGIGCAVDPASGEILKCMHHAVDLSKGHPDTGQPIVGRRLPFWEQAVALTLASHSTAFPKFATLGWDVVLTPDGPLLLEANSGWGTMGQQIYFGPIGQTALARIVEEELSLAQ